MLLELTHETTFDYTDPVTESHLEFRLTPLTDGSQHLLQHRSRVTPACPIRTYVDSLGNTVSYFNLLQPHERIEVTFDSVVETFPLQYRGGGIPAGAREVPAARCLLYDYLRPTPLTQPCPEFEEFVRPLLELRGAPVREAAEHIRNTIYGGFRYEGDVTSASSPISDLLQQGAGVCQDFSHLMLATCRHLGYPARYVSGYVLPDDTREVAASHAWCEVFDPDQGWFGIDPTHNAWVEERHVRLGVGRDYKDVPPNRGVYRGLGREAMKVKVVLRPISPEELAVRARALYPQTRGGGYVARTANRRAPALSIIEHTQYAQQQQQ